MKNNILSCFVAVIVAMCIYSPNIPSGGFLYAPEVPEEILKLRK